MINKNNSEDIKFFKSIYEAHKYIDEYYMSFGSNISDFSDYSLEHYSFDPETGQFYNDNQPKRNFLYAFIFCVIQLFYKFYYLVYKTVKRLKIKL